MQKAVPLPRHRPQGREEKDQPPEAGVDEREVPVDPVDREAIPEKEGERDGRVDQDEQAQGVKTGKIDDEGGKPRPERQAEEERALPPEDDGDKG